MLAAVLGTAMLGIVPLAQAEPVTGDVITVDATHVNPDLTGSYDVGDRLSLNFHVTNLTDATIGVIPDGDLQGFDPDRGSPNCRYGTLAANASYTCTTAFHLVTQEDLDAGSLTPDVTFTARQGGQNGAVLETLTVAAPTVDLTPNGLVAIDRSDWTVTASSEETSGESGQATRAIDGDPATFWHTRYTPSVDPLPHELTIDMGAEHTIGTFTYLPRQDRIGHNGTFVDYEIHTSLDGETWELAAEGAFAPVGGLGIVELEPVEARYVMLRGLSTANDTQFGGAAEVNVYAAPETPVAPDYDATWGGEPFYTEQQLATNGQGGFPNYRIPALTVTNEGDVLASYDGRPTGADSPGPNSILQRRSTDNGETWGEQTVIRAGKTTQPIEGYSDPSYIVDRHTGDIFNFHVFSMDRGFGNSQAGVDPEDRNVIHANVSRSSDNGETWTHETITADITADVANWRSRFAASGQGIQLKYGPYAGRLIQQYTIINEAVGTYQAVSVYSDDHGETWQVGEPVGTGMDENKTVELSDGRVMLNSRDSARSGFRKVAISTDGGHSYGDVVVDRELPDPTNNASIVRAFPNAEEGSAEAKVLLFSNAGSSSARVNGVVRMSCDDGETWPVSKVFQPGGMAYSTLATQPDGSIGLLYEPGGGGGGIRYANFNLAWLGGICAGVEIADVAADAGTTTDVEVTVTNQTSADLSAGELTLDLPEDWSAEPAAVPALAGGESAVVTVSIDVPEGAFAGEYPLTANLTTDQGTSSGTFTFTVNAAEGDLITVVPEFTNPSESGEYVLGDRLSFSYRVTNISDEAVSVVPTGNLAGLERPTAPNCGWQNLAAGASYTCTTAFHIVSQTDLDAASFTPETTWTVHEGSYSGPVLGSIERNGPTVATVGPENLIPQTEVSVADVSSEETARENTPASNVLDGNPATFWHTNWDETTAPHHITFDLGATYEVETLRYLARQAGNLNGTLENYSIYVSADGETWGDPVATGTSPNTRELQVIDLDPKEGRFVRLVFESSYGDTNADFASAAEVNFQGVLVEEPTEEPTTEEPTTEEPTTEEPTTEEPTTEEPTEEPTTEEPTTEEPTEEPTTEEPTTEEPTTEEPTTEEPTTEEPTVPADGELELSDREVRAGESVTVSGGGFVPGETVVLAIGDLELGTAVADDQGVLNAQVQVPADLEPGVYVLTATGAEQVLSVEFEVLAASVDPAPTTPAAPTSPSGDGDGGPGAGGGDGLPSTGASVGAASLLVLALLGAGGLLIARRKAVTQS